MGCSYSCLKEYHYESIDVDKTCKSTYSNDCQHNVILKYKIDENECTIILHLDSSEIVVLYNGGNLKVPPHFQIKFDNGELECAKSTLDKKLNKALEQAREKSKIVNRFLHRNKNPL